MFATFTLTTFWQVNDTRMIKAQAKAVLSEAKKCGWHVWFFALCTS